MRKGETRSCPHCGEVKESKFFPFPKRPECYICYEKVTGTYQKAFRQKLGLQIATPKNTKKKQRFVCTNCWYETNIQFTECPNCKGTTTYVQNVSTHAAIATPAPKKKPTTTPARIVAVESYELENYLKRHLANRSLISIRYQSQRQNSAKKWRDLSVTSFDNTYITVDGYNGIPYRYRRDRVVEIR